MAAILNVPILGAPNRGAPRVPGPGLRSIIGARCVPINRRGRGVPLLCASRPLRPPAPAAKPASRWLTAPWQPLRNAGGRPAVACAAVKEENKVAKVAAQGEGEEEDRLNLFKGSEYTKRWDVPWSWKVTLGGTISWGIVFGVTGIIVAPLLSQALGFGPIYAIAHQEKLTTDQSALYAVFNQVLETGFGIGIIYAFTAKFRPFDDPDIFRLSFKRPFAKKDGWLLWAILGYMSALVTVGVVSAGFSLAGWDAANADGNGTVDAVSQIITSDVGPFFALLSVTSLMAPLLEEYVFRGFLLTSFTKWMPTPAAIVLSAGFFAAAHLSVRDFPQLLALGTVLGFSYVRTRNLATPMIIHSTWNSAVLLLLTVLVASGYDINELLHGGPVDGFLIAGKAAEVAGGMAVGLLP